MSDENGIRVVEVPAMSVASFHAFGPSPEHLAFEKMKTWLEARGVTRGSPPARVFGFNNPSPSTGTPNYGYEFWVELRAGTPLAEAASQGDVVVKVFAGGKYAGLHHTGTGETIPETWKRLVRLAATAGHGHAGHQWLEEHYLDLSSRSEILSLDCLAPIR